MPPQRELGTVEICILAGGLSSRMGKDKSRLRLGGRTMLGWARRVGKEMNIPARVIRRDLVSRCGPLGGIYTGLATTKYQGAIFLSCDMPFVSPELIRFLMGEKDEATAALFLEAQGRAGFPFFLERSLLPAIEHQIESREFSLQELARKLSAKIISVPPSLAVQLFNVNTPEEFEAISNLKSEI